MSLRRSRMYTAMSPAASEIAGSSIEREMVAEVAGRLAEGGFEPAGS